MNKISLLILVVILQGCAEWQAFTTGIGSYGSQASDEELKASIWMICNATPVGAIERRFNTPEKREIYREMCGYEI